MQTSVYIKDKALVDVKNKKVILARDGVMQYLGSELGIAGDTTVYNVLRTTNSVNNVCDEINTAGKIPLTIEHPKKFLDLSDEMNYKKGIVKDSYIETKDGYSVVCGIIDEVSDEMMEKLDAGQEVSLGSKAEIKPVVNDSYSFTMEVKEVNHLAIVDRGRCGSTCAIMDGFMIKEDTMIKEVIAVDEEIQETVEISGEPEEKTAGEPEVKIEEVEVEVKPEGKVEAEATEEKSEVVDKSIMDEKIKEATQVGFDKGVDTMLNKFNDAFNMITAGHLKAEEFADKMPCEVIDNKLKSLFQVKEIADNERAGFLALAVKKQIKDGWNFGQEVKVEDNKPKANVSSFLSMFNKK